MTEDRIVEYQTHRLNEGASRATVNRECAALGRAFSLAVELKKLSLKPKIKKLDGERVRQGFVEHGDFMRLVDALPVYLQDFTEFLYRAGWRRGAVSKLQWSDIDREGRTARLRIESSKNKEPWVLPLVDRLWEIIEKRFRERSLGCPYVFHRNGRKIGEVKKAWKTACVAAGLGHWTELENDGKKRKVYVGLIPHDLRRCAARNLSRAGVPEQVAMKITTHRTSSQYRRYRIIDESELRGALERLELHLANTAKTTVVPMRAANQG